MTITTYIDHLSRLRLSFQSHVTQCELLHDILQLLVLWKNKTIEGHWISLVYN